MREPMLPRDIEAEHGVLGSLIIDPEAIDRVADTLSASDFYREENATLYTAIMDLYSRRIPADFITICNLLERQNTLELVGGPGYITGLAEQVPTSGNAEHYAKLIAECALQRRFIRMGTQMVQAGYARDTDIMEKAMAQLYEIGQKADRHDFQSTKALMPGYLEELDRLHEHRGQIIGVPSGYADLDRAMCGFQPELTVICGRPGSGKTSLAQSLIYNAGCLGFSSATFSLEMGARALMLRFMSMRSKVGMQRLRTGWVEDDEWEKVIRSAEYLSELPIWINDTAGNPITSMRKQLRKLIQKQGKIDFVVVDHLGLIEPEEGKNDNRTNEVSKITRGLHLISNEFNVPVIALCQLSRKVEERKDKHPMLSDLRDAGTIEENAANVLGIYRDDYYATQENRLSERPGIMDVSILKQRNGPTGAVQLYFKAEETMVYPLEAAPALGGME